MKEKNWKEMNGWEKAWEVTQITFGALVIALGLLGLGKGRQGSRGGQGGSVWTVGSSGKKSGSWSSGRHGQLVKECTLILVLGLGEVKLGGRQDKTVSTRKPFMKG